uniref:Uncharacterized protein n=1 Tax=Meloidogyne enterolobii TaxID=390850 RepID=A0A6V7TNM2_MELEN|nr:unnamed protein product [Meloidogyne enterolobii]
MYISLSGKVFLFQFFFLLIVFNFFFIYSLIKFFIFFLLVRIFFYKIKKIKFLFGKLDSELNQE